MSQSGSGSSGKANKTNASVAEQTLCKELQPILQMVSAAAAVLQPCYSIIESASNQILSCVALQWLKNKSDDPATGKREAKTDKARSPEVQHSTTYRVLSLCASLFLSVRL